MGKRETSQVAETAKPCAGCRHPEKRVIDVKLGKNESIALLAQRFELSEEDLISHRKHAQAPRERYGETWTSIVDHLCYLKEVGEERLANAEDAKSTASLLRELREIDIAIGKQRDIHRGCISQANWKQLQDILLSVLDRHPDIHEEVSAAIEKVEEVIKNGNHRV